MVDLRRKGQITIGYVLSITIIIAVISFSTFLILRYRDSMLERYEKASLKIITADVSHLITTIYVEGYESSHIPEMNESSLLSMGSILLPDKIGNKDYTLDINGTEKNVCCGLEDMRVCSRIVGLPKDFNITSRISVEKTFNVSYWRENNNTIVDYIIIE